MKQNKLNKIELETFDKACAEIRNNSQNNYLRTGQIMYIVLAKSHPSLAREINGTEIDPFYDDRKIKLFIEFISNNT